MTITNGSSTTQTPNFAGGTPNDPTNFGGSQNCAGVALDPGATCQFTYTFEPATPGDHTSSTTIGIDGDNFSIAMSGHAEFPLTVAPTDMSFPDTAVGDTSSMAVVVTNVSPTALTPNYAGGAPTDPTNFGGSQNCAGVAWLAVSHASSRTRSHRRHRARGRHRPPSMSTARPSPSPCTAPASTSSNTTTTATTRRRDDDVAGEPDRPGRRHESANNPTVRWRNDPDDRRRHVDDDDHDRPRAAHR